MEAKFRKEKRLALHKTLWGKSLVRGGFRKTDENKVIAASDIKTKVVRV